jgi:hypothetical protein
MAGVIVLKVGDRTLMDREALAQWTQRSPHTVRLRCPVYRYASGTAIYDADACADLLDAVPTRRRAA